MVWYTVLLVEKLGWLVGLKLPATTQGLALLGQQITVSDAKARRDLGYVGHVTREMGYQSIKEWEV